MAKLVSVKREVAPQEFSPAEGTTDPQVLNSPQTSPAIGALGWILTLAFIVGALAIVAAAFHLSPNLAR